MDVKIETIIGSNNPSYEVASIPATQEKDFEWSLTRIATAW